MKNPLNDVFRYAQMIVGKWILWLFAAVDIVALIVQFIYPAFHLPQWIYLLIMLVGFFWAGYEVHRDVIVQLPTRPIKPLPYEILPISFDIELDQEIPRINIWLYVINYQSNKLDIHSLKVFSFCPSTGPNIDDISLTNEISIPPKQFKQIWCHRNLSDAEARSIAKTHLKNPINATFLVDTQASVGRKRLHQETPQISSNGWSSGMPDPPQGVNLWDRR